MKTSDSDELREKVALKLGWQWISFIDVPIRGTPGYPMQCRVRRFMPMECLNNEQWRKYLESKEWGPATGSEPLDYAYCSSDAPDAVPAYPSSPDACEAVLEWLTGHGWEVDMHASKDGAACRLHDKYGAEYNAVAGPQQLPLAICRAFVQVP